MPRAIAGGELAPIANSTFSIVAAVAAIVLVKHENLAIGQHLDVSLLAQHRNARVFAQRVLPTV